MNTRACRLLYFGMRMSEVPQENGARLVLERSKKKLSHEERVAFGFIAACGIGAVIFGGLSVLSNIKKPFLISYTGPRYVTSSEQESEEVARQRMSDTDNDGVSDYDELHIFATSPYIADSDSDGRSDGAEIMEGGDPNCALGKTCASSELVQDRVSASFLNTEEPTAPDAAVPSLEDAVGALQQLSIGEIRQLMIASGVSEEDLSQLSDEEVMALYLEALGLASEEIEQETASSAGVMGEEMGEATP